MRSLQGCAVRLLPLGRSPVLPLLVAVAAARTGVVLVLLRLLLEGL